MMKSPIVKLLMILLAVPCFIVISHDFQEELFRFSSSSPEFLNVIYLFYGFIFGFLILFIPLFFLSILAIAEEIFDHFFTEDSACEVER